MTIYHISIFSKDNRQWSWIARGAAGEDVAVAGILEQLPDNSQDFGPVIVASRIYLH